MPRINLSIDDDFFKSLQGDANKYNCTVNVYLITLLEQMYRQNPFDYQAALETLEEEAKSQPSDENFTLVDLPSFSELCRTVYLRKLDLKRERLSIFLLR